MSHDKRLKLLATKTGLRVPVRYDNDGKASDWETPLVCPEQTLTIQSEKDNCDINVILARYAAANEIPIFPEGKEGRFGDFRNTPNFQEAMDRVAQAKEYFDTLPAEIRSRFKNEPAQLLDFMEDETNNEEAIKLGLRKAEPEQAAPTAPTPPAPPAPPTGSGTPPGA